jgi:hypothetical protein
MVVLSAMKARTQGRKSSGRSTRDVRQVWGTVEIKAHLSAGRGDLAIVLMVITFHRCLPNGHTPQLPCEHHAKS